MKHMTIQLSGKSCWLFGKRNPIQVAEGPKDGIVKSRYEGYFPISDSQCFIGAKQLKMGIRGGQNDSIARIRPPFFAGGTAATLVCFGPPLQIAQGLEAQSYDEWVKELRYI